MEQASLPNADAMDLLEAQIRESFGRVVYTHKTQEKCADIKLSTFNRMRWAQNILAAVTSTGFFAVVFGDPAYSRASALCAGIASTLLVIVNAYMQGSNAVQEAEKHTTTASRLWVIREAYISLITDVRSKSIALDDAKAKRDALELKLGEIYTTAPRTTAKAYKAAQVALKLNEELTFSEVEIDLMLPVALRKAQSSQPSQKTDQKA